MVSIDHILSEVSHLNKEEQFDLLQRLVVLIRKEEKKHLKLSSISGVGADIWKGIDIDKYVASEREW